MSCQHSTGLEPVSARTHGCEECMKEPGCEQFEVFQSVLDPDRLALLERWTDQAALDTHAQLNRSRPALRPELRVGSGERIGMARRADRVGTGRKDVSRAGGAVSVK